LLHPAIPEPAGAAGAEKTTSHSRCTSPSAMVCSGKRHSHLATAGSRAQNAHALYKAVARARSGARTTVTGLEVTGARQPCCF